MYYFLEFRLNFLGFMFSRLRSFNSSGDKLQLASSSNTFAVDWSFSHSKYNRMFICNPLRFWNLYNICYILSQYRVLNSFEKFRSPAVVFVRIANILPMSLKMLPLYLWFWSPNNILFQFVLLYVSKLLFKWR